MGRVSGDDREMNICVIGLGEIGLPTALYCQQHNMDTWCFDKSPAAVRNAEIAGLKATTEWYGHYNATRFLVCVNTDFDGEINVSQVYDACKLIYANFKAKGRTDEIIVSIESTIVPGITEDIWEKIFKEDPKIHLVHVPQRFWGADPEGRGIRRLRLIGSVNLESQGAAIGFYHNVLKMPLIPVELKVAEMAKVTENAYRYLQISFAQQLKMVCVEMGISFEQVREAIMTADDMHYLPEARNGIGGHCLPMAANWLSHLQYKHLPKTFITILDAAKTSDTEYRKWVGDRNHVSKM